MNSILIKNKQVHKQQHLLNTIQCITVFLIVIITVISLIQLAN